MSRDELLVDLIHQLVDARVENVTIRQNLQQTQPCGYWPIPYEVNG